MNWFHQFQHKLDKKCRIFEVSTVNNAFQVHTDHWKTQIGAVVILINPSLMKNNSSDPKARPSNKFN